MTFLYDPGQLQGAREASLLGLLCQSLSLRPADTHCNELVAQICKAVWRTVIPWFLASAAKGMEQMAHCASRRGG